MIRTKTFVKTIKRIGLLSGVGLIAISASAFPGTAASAAAPAANQQVAEGQQQQNSPPQWQQQQRPDKNHQGGQGQSRQQGSQHNGQGQPRQQWTQQNGKPQGQQQWSQQGGQQHWQQNSQGHRYNWASYTPGHRPAQWDQYHRNFDPRAYETARYAERRYHWEPYRQPYGWYYRQWSYGQYLPIAFWARDYWLDTYWNFGLIDPPYGYVWVRYGPDALLVDVAAGQILSVEYGVFYS
jgi:Ni/Co efflux regulator RcnB